MNNNSNNTSDNKDNGAENKSARRTITLTIVIVLGLLLAAILLSNRSDAAANNPTLLTPTSTKLSTPTSAPTSTKSATQTSTAAPTPTAPVQPTSTPNPILNINWLWTSVTEQSTNHVTTVPNPNLYTLVFHADGTVSGVADCNTFSGTFSQNNGLTIRVTTVTQAVC